MVIIDSNTCRGVTVWSWECGVMTVLFKVLTLNKKWKEGGKGQGMLDEFLPCKTMLTINATCIPVKATNRPQSKSTWNPGSSTSKHHWQLQEWGSSVLLTPLNCIQQHLKTHTYLVFTWVWMSKNNTVRCTVFYNIEVVSIFE